MMTQRRLLCVFLTCWTLMVLGSRPAVAQRHSGPQSYESQRPEDSMNMVDSEDFIESSEILPDTQQPILPAPELFGGGISPCYRLQDSYTNRTLTRELNSLRRGRDMQDVSTYLKGLIRATTGRMWPENSMADATL